MELLTAVLAAGFIAKGWQSRDAALISPALAKDIIMASRREHAVDVSERKAIRQVERAEKLRLARKAEKRAKP